MGRFPLLLALAVALYGSSALRAQRTDAFVEPRDHPAIAYSRGETADVVDALNRRLERGDVRLRFDSATGYLPSVLEALDVPVESQVALFDQNSFQAPEISMANPRALYFNDAVAVGYVRGGALLEVAALDPRQGVIFYALDQKPVERPRFTRNDDCLACHLSWTTLGVPGLFVLSMQTVPEDTHAYASGFASDHRTAFDERWGGWYVTGSLGGIRHLGNRPISTASTPEAVHAEARELASLAGAIDTSGYLTPYSDVAALMVLEHQTHMTNLIVRLGWEARVAVYGRGESGADGPLPPNVRARLDEAASDLVDYLLFAYEAPLPAAVMGSSGFAEKFAARGPFDRQGRSLRQLDLTRRLLRYPCSYMIYSAAFEALPAVAKNLVYRRLWRVLSGADQDARYRRLSPADRRAISEILVDTKKDLPEYFKRPV